MSKFKISDMLHLLIVTVIIGSVWMVFAKQGFAEKGKYSGYPPQTIPCFKAREQMGDETFLVELSGIGTVGENDCSITLMFENEGERKKFENMRVEKGLSPDYELYRGKNIPFEIHYGTMMLPHEPTPNPLTKD